MIHKQAASNNLHFYSSDLLPVSHGMFSRYGGVSSPPFADLNLSFGVGDKAESVSTNRLLLQQYFNIRYLVSAVQVHGDRVIAAENIREDIEYEGADALMTRHPGVGLLIQQADCQAVLLHDPIQQVIAAVHNGWKGSVLNIIGTTIAAMQEQYRINPADIRAVISPSLGPCCAEFINWQQELSRAMHRHQVKKNHFDFWTISREQLIMAGVKENYIEVPKICTVCDQAFFSYRRAVQQNKYRGELGITGRCGSLIMLS